MTLAECTADLALEERARHCEVGGAAALCCAVARGVSTKCGSMRLARRSAAAFFAEEREQAGECMTYSNQSALSDLTLELSGGCRDA